MCMIVLLTPGLPDGLRTNKPIWSEKNPNSQKSQKQQQLKKPDKPQTNFNS